MKRYFDFDGKNQQIAETLQSIDSCSFNKMFNLYEIEDYDLNEYEELKDLNTLTFEELQAKVIENSKKQVKSINDRVYLDFVPFKFLEHIENHKSVFFYDSARKQYYIDINDAMLKQHFKVVSKCMQKKELTAIDFGEAVITPGREALATALNQKDPVKREVATAEALALCAKEYAYGVKGAISNFGEVIRANKMIGRELGFIESYSLAKSYYKAIYQARSEVNKQNARQKIATVTLITGEIIDDKTKETKVDDIVSAILKEQAAKNIKEPFSRRIAHALRQKDYDTVLTLAGSAICDYVEGHTLLKQSKLALGQKSDNHNNNAFMAQLTSTVLGAKGSNDEKIITKILHMGHIASDKCVEIDQLINMCVNTKRGVADPNNIPRLVSRVSNMAPDLRKYFLDKDFFKALEKNDSQKVKKNVLSGKAEPLYLVANREQRKELNELHKDKLKVDEVYNVLCVEDTKENREIFAQFLPTASVEVKLDKSIEELRSKAVSSLKANGFDVEHNSLVTEKWVNDKKDKSKAYIVNMQSGVPRMQMIDRNGTLNETVILGHASAQEKQLIKENYERTELQKQALKLQQQADTAKVVRENIVNLQSPDKEYVNTYLDKKGLKAADFKDALFDKSGKYTANLVSKTVNEMKDVLVLPMINGEGKVMSAQFIDAQGNKFFAKGAPFKGNFIAVSGYESLKNANNILIAEGAATAASIAKMAPEGTAVVACLSANNMLNVTKVISSHFPHASIGLMADNDVKTAGVNKLNPGLNAAYSTVKALSVERPYMPVITPPLTLKQLMNGYTDFNDSYMLNPELCKKRINEGVVKANQAYLMNIKAKEAIKETHKDLDVSKTSQFNIDNSQQKTRGGR